MSPCHGKRQKIPIFKTEMGWKKARMGDVSTSHLRASTTEDWDLIFSSINHMEMF
jgi:hypothetical protein